MSPAIETEILDLLVTKKEEEKGFHLLMKTYGSLLRNQILRLVKDDQDVDDVLQNVLIKVMKGISSFKGQSSLYSWLYRIAYNESINHLNKRKLYYQRNDMLKVANLNKVQAVEMPDASYILEVLHDAIQKLPEKQRLVFELRYFNEKTYKEMSALLQTSEGALKASYHHAVKKIENHIAEVSTYSYES